jgi:hypothetical protein
MQLGDKPIIDWKTILIDTGVIMALLAGQRGNTKDEGLLFVNKLVNFLCRNKTGKNEERTIYISTISLGEVITKESGPEKIKLVLKALDSNNVEFLSFDTITALEFNIKLQPYLEKEALHAKAKELGFATQDYGMARQWISKDYMIAMTAFVKNVDVILTLDKKTFYPICKDFNGTGCVLAYHELFEHTETFVLKYDYNNVDNFLNKTAFETLNQKSTFKPRQPVQTDLLSVDATNTVTFESKDGAPPY